MERARRRIVLSAAVAGVAVLTLAACGDDESATDQVCDARSSLRDSVESVTSDISEGNFGEARDELGDVQEDYDELVSALGELSDEQQSALQPEVDALRSAVEALPQAENLEDLGTGIETVLTDVQGIYDSITQSLDCS
jgi:hypothetical protein